MNPTAFNKRPIPKEHLDAVADMDISMFNDQDVLNLILQRSQILFDLARGGRLIKAWMEGDPAPLMAQVEERPEVLIRRALAAIHAEFTQYLPVLRKISPARMADIGCGYGFFDVFAARELGTAILLIDLEESENRNFGYKRQGAAYSNLNCAQAFARANGLAEDQVQAWNPGSEKASNFKPVDLVVSFLSCGFHYPVTTYMDFFRDKVTERGHLILDLNARRADEQRDVLSSLGQVTSLETNEQRDCVLVEKRG